MAALAFFSNLENEKVFLQCWLTALSCSPGCSAGYDRDVPRGDSGSIKPLTPNMQKWFIPHLSDGMHPCKVAWIPVSFPRKAALPDSTSFACPLSQTWPWKFIHDLCVFLSPSLSGLLVSTGQTLWERSGEGWSRNAGVLGKGVSCSALLEVCCRES